MKQYSCNISIKCNTSVDQNGYILLNGEKISEMFLTHGENTVDIVATNLRETNDFRFCLLENSGRSSIDNIIFDNLDLDTIVNQPTTFFYLHSCQIEENGNVNVFCGHQLNGVGYFQFDFTIPTDQWVFSKAHEIHANR